MYFVDLSTEKCLFSHKMILSYKIRRNPYVSWKFLVEFETEIRITKTQEKIEIDRIPLFHSEIGLFFDSAIWTYNCNWKKNKNKWRFLALFSRRNSDFYWLFQFYGVYFKFRISCGNSTYQLRFKVPIVSEPISNFGHRLTLAR